MAILCAQKGMLGFENPSCKTDVPTSLAPGVPLGLAANCFGHCCWRFLGLLCLQSVLQANQKIAVWVHTPPCSTCNSA